MKTFRYGLLFLAAGAALAGCSTTPDQPVAPAQPMIATAPSAPAAASPSPARPESATPAAQSSAQAVVPSSATTTTLPPHLDPRHPIASERSVYFDFDDYTLKNDYSAMLERHGRYLASRPSLAVKIEGNTDERGSAEYNLALGQRRAETVLRTLKIYGAKDAQLEAISWGEERPRAAGHQADAWAQNRRADLVYPRQ